ncbi:MAG: hypothetical protein RQ733_02645 [Methyloprofundus sp.]|nr:hypothetical protein [Methyloprofundus sp.]MDT8424852.1 hypothetical protein [Methyloprofundus sp.]
MATQEGRRSFLLGITLNELGFIMFFLLMMVSAATLQNTKQKLAQETQQKAKLQAEMNVQQASEENFKRLQLLENRLILAAGFSTKPSEQQLDALFARLQEAQTGIELQQANSQLQGELETLQDYKKLVDVLAKKGLAEASPQAVEKLLGQAEIALQEQETLKGQLVYMQNKLQANGLDHPPCWADAQSGAVEYLYRITLYENNMQIAAAWPAYRKAGLRLIPGAEQLAGQTLTQQQLDNQVAPLFAWSKTHRCRHFVRIKDDSKTSKEAYKRQMLAIEAYFYKYLER